MVRNAHLQWESFLSQLYSAGYYKIYQGRGALFHSRGFIVDDIVVELK